MRWPEGYLTDNQWMELLAIEYTITHYPNYYNDTDYDKEVSRMQYLRELRNQPQ